MGYLLTKKAETNVQPADSETAGNILGSLVAGGGLAGTGAIGNSLFKKKLLNNAAYSNAVDEDTIKMMQKIYKSDNAIAKLIKGPLAKRTPELTSKGIQLAAGLKNLRLPGKLKALGLLAAPLAAGGLVDAAVD